jgi:hypothetical protein
MIIGQGGENQDYKASAAIARRESGFVSILAACQPGPAFSHYEIKYRNLKNTKTTVRIFALEKSIGQ